MLMLKPFLDQKHMQGSASGSTQPALQPFLHWILRALVVFIVICCILWKLHSLLAFHGAQLSQEAEHLACHHVRELSFKVIFYQMLILLPSRCFFLG